MLINRNMLPRPQQHRIMAFPLRTNFSWKSYLAAIDTYRLAGKKSSYDLDNMSDDTRLGKEDRLFKS